MLPGNNTSYSVYMTDIVTLLCYYGCSSAPSIEKTIVADQGSQGRKTEKLYFVKSLCAASTLKFAINGQLIIVLKRFMCIFDFISLLRMP